MLLRRHRQQAVKEQAPTPVTKKKNTVTKKKAADRDG